MCYHKAGCEYYTWYENSTAFMNICFLLSSCEDNVNCTGCSSGSSQCDHCKEIEYNLLDDPTRNEKHGKYIWAGDKNVVVKLTLVWNFKYYISCTNILTQNKSSPPPTPQFWAFSHSIESGYWIKKKRKRMYCDFDTVIQYWWNVQGL